MNTSSSRRLALTWLALSAVTVVSWYIGATHGRHEFRINALVTFGVLGIAGLKVRFIIMEFMEARRAPALLRRITDAWLGSLMIALLAVYVIGNGIHVQA